MLFDEPPKKRVEDLYNFKEELEQLIETLRAGTRLTVITGLRRTGKTSLLLTALEEGGFKHVVVDARILAQHPTISRKDFINSFERDVNKFLTREKSWAKKFFDRARGVRGVELFFDPLPRISLSWGPTLGESTDLPALIETLGKTAEERGTRVVLAFDEAQELRRLAGYNLTKLFAYIYDHVAGVQLVVTGSQVGLLQDFLGVDNATSPLYGRARVNIRTRMLTAEEAEEFLRIGFEQIGMRVEEKLLAEAVERVGGIVGWLTYLGATARRRKRFDKGVITEALEEGAKLAAKELENFLFYRLQARNRYLTILKYLADRGKARWSWLKRGLEVEEGRSVADNIFTNILVNLVKAGYVAKDVENTYYIPDPMLVHALRLNLVR
ncbi:MAG: ATP-binding protein [Methanobacteriota archaeon]|nr:MAG: ATP-binding protein [Euryarchaeota archaeon]